MTMTLPAASPASVRPRSGSDTSPLGAATSQVEEDAPRNAAAREFDRQLDAALDRRSAQQTRDRRRVLGDDAERDERPREDPAAPAAAPMADHLDRRVDRDRASEQSERPDEVDTVGGPRSGTDGATTTPPATDESAVDTTAAGRSTSDPSAVAGVATGDVVTGDVATEGVSADGLAADAPAAGELSESLDAVLTDGGTAEPVIATSADPVGTGAVADDASATTLDDGSAAGSVDPAAAGAAGGEPPIESTATAVSTAEASGTLEDPGHSVTTRAGDGPAAVTAGTPGGPTAGTTTGPIQNTTAPAPTATPAPGAPLDTAVTPGARGVELAELGERLGASLRRNVRFQSLSIQLHPAELGAVRIEAKLVDGVTHLVISPDSATGGERLAGALRELRHDLARAGVDVGDLDLRQGGDHGASASDGDRDGRADTFAGGPRSASRSGPSNGAPTPPAPSSTTTTTFHGATLAVDL